MTRFNLVDKWYIRDIDPRNWGLCESVKTKHGDTDERVHGYYGTLARAWAAAVDRITLKAGTQAKLISIVKQLEELKKDL